MLLAPLLLGVVLHHVPFGRIMPRHVVASPAGPAALTMGTRRLRRCVLAIPGYCGTLTVPLNWLNRTDGTISIRFQVVPAWSGHVVGTIVAQEGGPGYASTGTGNSYAALFRPLMRDRNLVMMDERGTGASAPIDCKPLQNFAGSTATSAYQWTAEACGDQLNHTYARSDGRYVHASDLFNTSQSVRDLRAILLALRTGPVDLYGDSYGSFFGQVFGARYPELLRSLVLDSTYQVLEQPPFDPNGQAEVRFAYDRVCERSLACQAIGGAPLERIARLDARLDTAPLVAHSSAPDGTPVTVHASGPELETLLTAGGYDFGPYRNLDAASRAWFERGDSVPLARLFAWTIGGPAFFTYPYTEYSAGQDTADSCTVYTPPFDKYASVARRSAQYAERSADLPPRFAFPVGNIDALRAPDELYDQCLSWPAPEHVDPIVSRAPPLVPLSLPVLIVSGDLDMTTAPGDAREAQSQLGPSARFVTFPNSDHTPALGDGGAVADVYDCAAAVVQSFIARPRGALDASCAKQIPEIRSAGAFPLRLGDEPVPAALPGNEATPDELRLAAVAVSAAGDATQSGLYLYEGFNPNCRQDYCGPGLRGGRVRASGDLTTIALDRVAFSADTLVSGRVARSDAIFPTAPAAVVATLQAGATGGSEIELVATYDEREPHAIATLRGHTAGGHRIAARMPAP